MAGMLLESGIVLVPLGAASLYIIAKSNTLLFIFSILAAISLTVIMRLRYHYASGARVDLVVRKTESRRDSAPPRNLPKTSKKGKKSKKQDKNSDNEEEEGEFSEIIQTARNHHDIDGEEVERSGELLSTVVTTDSTKFDMDMYGSGISFDHRCFYIEGKPVWLLAADFDYWRIPAADAKVSDEIAVAAWTRMLLQLKATGFNAVRIRFNWAFHSSRKGQYDFKGVRNVSKLLTLCEDLGIYVIACVGPYIGDDVQAGGFPFWLVQRNHIRLRHMWHASIKRWDDRYAAAVGEWYDNIVSLIVGHEVVTKNVRGRGCVVLVQLENHLEERGMLGLPLALQDETRLLARMCRERVIRAPLITNNLNWPADFTSRSSLVWRAVTKRLRRHKLIGKEYKTDISGFTLRDVTANPVDMNAIAAATGGDNSPMVALELYKGTEGSAALFSTQVENALIQGISAFALPGFVARNTWGNLDSPQVAADATGKNNAYAAISADGTLTDDARTTKLILQMARALQLQAAASDIVNSRPWIARAQKPTVRGVHGHGLPATAVQVRRQWEYEAAGRSKVVGADKVAGEQFSLLAFVDGSAKPGKEIALQYALADASTLGGTFSFAMTATLGPRNRGMFASNLKVTTTNGDVVDVVASTKEIYARVALPKQNAEAWVCAAEEVQSGQLFVLGECNVTGHADVEIVDIEHAKDHKFSFVMPKPGAGIAKITAANGASIVLVMLPQRALDTLAVNYASDLCGIAQSAAWGADGIIVGPGAGSVDIARMLHADDPHVYLLSDSQPTVPASSMLSKTDGAGSPYAGHAFVWHLSAASSPQSAVPAAVLGFEKRVTDFDSLPWKLLPTMADLETMDEINVMSWQRDLGTFAYQATDIGRNASHTLYRCQVRLKPQHIKAPKIELQLNARHRCTVWVNGHSMSGHETAHAPHAPTQFKRWTEALRTPGTLCGPDRWGGTVTYDVTKAMRISGAEDEEGALNEVFVIVESFGVGTQSDGYNDAHAPRGLIAAYWHGYNLIGEDHDDSEIHDTNHDHRTEQLRTRWDVCGVDVSELPQSLNSSGLPDELQANGWTTSLERPFADTDECWSTRLDVKVDNGVHWWRWELKPAETADKPAYLNVSGKATAYVWVNGVLLAKHRATDTPSCVLLRGGSSGLMDVLRNSKGSDKVQVMAYGWAEHADIAQNMEADPTIGLEVSITSTPTTKN